MNITHTSRILGLCTILVFGTAGCVVSAGTGSGSGHIDPHPTDGTLSVLTSIEGSIHPSECDYAGAMSLEVAIYDGPDRYATVTASCYDFQLVVSLPEGNYNADVTLLDWQSYAVSTTLTLDDLRIISGTDLQVEVDFPASSLLP